MLAFTVMALDFSWVCQLLAVAVLWFVDRAGQKTNLREKVLHLATPLRWGIYLALIVAVVIFGIYGPLYDTADFIYFQF